MQDNYLNLKETLITARDLLAEAVKTLERQEAKIELLEQIEKDELEDPELRIQK